MDSVNQSEVFSPTASQRGAILSPVRARTMKEYDQQIADLRKENFNLKLKLYFLEEKMEKKYDGDSKELHRINIKLQVDVETLHKELEQKHKLLQDALGTLEKLEQNHRREIEELKETNSEEKCHIEGKLIALEKELQLEKQFRVKENDQNSEAYMQAFGLETSQASHDTNVPNSEQNKLNKLVKDLKDVICKKEEEIEVTKQRLSKEEEKIKVLEVKTQKRDKTIQGLIQTVNKKDKEIQQLNKIVGDRHEAIDSIDGAFSRTLYKATVAASKGDKNAIVEAKEELKTTLKEVLFSSSKDADAASGSASFSKEDLLEEVQRLRTELQMKDDNIKILEQQSTGRLQQVENLQHSLKLLQEEMSKSAHLHSKICSEKDAMIIQLQHSIQDTQKTMEDAFMGTDKASLEQECNALHQAIKEKDNFIQELLSERDKTAKEMEKSLQGLLNDLRLKDSTVQKLEKKLKEDLQCKEEEIQRLNKELSSSNETIRTQKEEKDALNLQIVQLREAQNYIETDLKIKNEKLNELTIKTEDLTEQLKNAEQQKSQIEQFFEEKQEHLNQANIKLNEINAELESKKLMVDHAQNEVQVKTEESKSLQNQLNFLQSALSETEHNLSVKGKELSSAYETIEKLKLDLEEAQKNVGLIFEVGCLTEQLREAEEEKHNLVKERNEKDVRLQHMVSELDNTRQQLHEKEVELVKTVQQLDSKSDELNILKTDLQFLQECLAKENNSNATANKKIKDLSKELEIIKAEMEKHLEDKEQVITDLQMKLNDIQLDVNRRLSQEIKVRKIEMASQTSEDSYQQLEEMRKEVKLREKAILHKDDFICKLHSALNIKNEELDVAKIENKSLSDQLTSIKEELVAQKKETEDLNKRILESIQERTDQESVGKSALDSQNQIEEVKVLLDELQQSKQQQKTLQDQVKEELSQIKAKKCQDRAKSNGTQNISPSAGLMSTIDNLRSQLDEGKLRNESLLSQLNSVVVHMASIVNRQSLITSQESHEGKLSDKENEKKVYRLQRMLNNLEKFLRNERKCNTNLSDEDSHEIERTSVPRAKSEPPCKEEKGIKMKDRCLRSSSPPFSSTQLQTLTDVRCLEHDQVDRLKDLLSKAQQEIQVLHFQNENNKTVARKQTALANYYRTQLQEAGCLRIPENLLLSKSEGDVTSLKEHKDIDVITSMSKANQLLTVDSVSQPSVHNLSHGKKGILETLNKNIISPNVRHSLPACLDGGRKSGGSPLWKQLQSHNLSHFGHSEDVCQLKEEVCVLVLRIEQLEKQAQNSLGNAENTVMHHDDVDKLQNQLFYSQRVCELLQSRLEELADFLEKLLIYDGNGHLNSSILTPECVDRVRQFITESKELSKTLSHSLIVSGGSSVFEGDSALYSFVHNDIQEQPTASTHLEDLKLNRNSILDHSDLMKDKTSQRGKDQIDEMAAELHRLKVQVADLELEKQQLKLEVKGLQNEKYETSEARKARKQKIHPDFQRIEMRLQNIEELNGTLQNDLRSHQEVIKKVFSKISDVIPSGEKSNPMAAVPRGLIEDHLHSLRVLEEKLERAIISNEKLTETLRGRLELEQELEEKRQAYSELLEAKNQLEKEVSMKGHLHQEVHTRLQNLMEDISDLRARLFEKDQQNKHAQDTMIAMEKDREARQKQCKEVQDWNLRLQKEIEEKETICKSLQTKLEDLKEQNASLENLAQQSDKRLTEIYEKYLKNNRSEEECTRLENEISKKEREASQLSRANENLRNQVMVKETQVETLEKDKSLLNLEVSKLNDKCITCNKIVSRLKEELSNTKDKLFKTEKDFSEMKEKINEYQTNENNFVTKASETEQQLLKAQYEVSELHNKHEWLEDQLRTKEEKLEQFSDKISWLENQIDQKQKELELSADKCVRLQKEFHENNQQYEVVKTDFEKQVKEKEHELDELKYQLKLRNEEYTKFQELEIKWTELVRENKRLQNIIANIKDKLHEKSDIDNERELKLDALEKEVKAKEKQVIELTKINDNLNNQLTVKEKQVSSLEQDKSLLSLEVSKFKEKCSTSDQMTSQFKEELLLTKTNLAKMRKTCSEMEEKIHQSQTSENHFVTKVSETEQQLHKAQHQISELHDKHEWLEDQIHTKDQKLQQFIDKISWLEQQINLKQKELEISADRCLKLQQEYHENNQQYEIAKNNFEQQLRDKGQMIEELMEKETHFKQQIQDRDQEHDKLQDWNMKIQETIQVKWIEELSEKNRLQKRVDALEEEIEHLKEKESSKTDNGKEHSGYKFSEFFKEKSRLEEELNATQQRLREVTQLNKSLQVELKVMDKLGVQKDDHAIVEAQAEQLEETSKALLLELVGELRQLRSALIKSTHVNSKLHRRIKQYSSKKEGTNSKLHSENAVSPVSNLTLASSGNFPRANTPEESECSLRGVPSYLLHDEVQHTSVNWTQPTCKNGLKDNEFTATKRKSSRNELRGSSLPNGHINTEVNSSDGSQQLSSGSADTETPQDTILSSNTIQPHLIDQSKRISSDLSSRQSSGEREGFRHGSNGTETPASGRPCYSSPDLGIESDPNREGGELAIRKGQDSTTWNKLADPKWFVSSSHSALDPVGISNKTNGSLSRLHRTFPGEQLPQDMIGLTDHDFSVSTPELCETMLHAVCWLKDYELLKKEIGESLVLLRGVEACVKNRLNSISVRNTSADKSLEYSTMKEINTNCVYLGGCLEKSWDIIACFWVTSIPLKKAVLSSTSLSPLIIENQKLRDELLEVRNQLSSQHKQLEEAMHKLSSVKLRKEGMEKAITKQLTKTRRVLQQAKGNLADGTKQEQPTKRPVAVVRYSKGESENLPENRKRV